VWGGGGLSNDHCTTPGPLRQISTNSGTPSGSIWNLTKKFSAIPKKKDSTSARIKVIGNFKLS
jgi:hypothetical protein